MSAMISLMSLMDAVVAFSRCRGRLVRRAMEEGTAELNRVYVRPEHRRRGCARQVVEVLELQALFQGFGRMVMEIGRDIPEAISLYRKMGYREIETLTIFADNKDTLCMEKELL